MEELTLRQQLRWATEQLAATSPTPGLDAEVLLAHILGWSRVRLLAESGERVPAAVRTQFAALVARRKELEPVAYLVGHKEFYGLELEVDRRVLVPRPETELLVERALAWAEEQPGQVRIADIGTGSGAIALVLAKYLPSSEIIAVDVSADALAVAAANLARHRLSERVRLVQGDLLAPLDASAPLDLLVSNPPYTILPLVDEGVRRHEPQLALDGGLDGLAIYRRLIEQATTHMRPGGTILLELGAGQSAVVGALARDALPGAVVRLWHDLAGIERVIDILIPSV